MLETDQLIVGSTSFKIFSVALLLTVLCGLVVYFPLPFLSEGLAGFIQQFSLLVGVNAGLVTIATYFVILVGNVKRDR